MTPYVTAEQFKKRFPETDLTDWEIENLLKAASLDTDALTFNRITACGFSRLTAFQQERIQEAVLLQADFRTQNAELFDTHHICRRGGDLAFRVFCVKSKRALCKEALICVIRRLCRRAFAIHASG